MASKEFDLVEEFVRSNEPQHRKNALTALAVINTVESIQRIAHAALEDVDAGVRKRAQDELVRIGPGAWRAAIELFRSALSSANEDITQRAYALLGLLRSKGAVLPKLNISRRRRLRLTARMNAHVYPVRNWVYRIRGWQPGLFGTLVGSVLFAVFVYTAARLRHTYYLNKTEMLLAIMGFAILTVTSGILIAILTTQRTTPIGLQPNRLSALIIETGSSTLQAIVGGLVLASFVIVLNAGDFTVSRLLRDFLIVPLFALLIGVVRAGTIFSFGVFKGRRSNRIAQVLGGIAFVSLVLNILVLALGSAQPSFYDTGVLWFAHIPLGIAAANAFASIDGEAPPGLMWESSRRWLFRLAIFIVLILVSISLTVLLALWFRDPPTPYTYLGG